MALSLVLVVTACSSASTTPGEAPARTTTTPIQANATQAHATPANPATLPSPCDILTPANAAALIGAGAVKQPLSAATHRCEYENPTTHATISVGVDTYDAKIALYGEPVTGLSADKAIWAQSSSQLILVKGTVILTIITMSADPAEGSKALAIRAGGIVLANL
jgi:hypothetical protein